MKMKTLTMYRPFKAQNPISDLGFFDVNRLFEPFFGDSIFNTEKKVQNHLPAVDIRETENDYLLDMELPGFDEKDIEINVEGANLFISSTKESAAEEKNEKDKENWLLRERRVFTSKRSFKLPENANPEEISAKFKNGILSIEIKKQKEALKKKIPIGSFKTET